MKTVFLDRDGVINRNLDNGYVKSWSEFEFLPNSLGAIRLLANAGYQIIVVTNQACINKGILSPRTLDVIHQKMISDVERTGGRIHAIYYCPHRDDENCTCRKPKTGMLVQAASEHLISLSDTYLIGDSTRDIEAGHQFGVYSLLVLTGHYSEPRQSRIGEINSGKKAPEKVFADLNAAACWIVSRDTKPDGYTETLS